MENLAFILWMIFFPFFYSLAETLRWKYGERVEYSVSTKGFAALLEMATWVFVGSLLYV